tara:strand:- start:50 stop:2119 length:2070 start_codon:yes stop_codon:yes gene_type:complete
MSARPQRQSDPTLKMVQDFKKNMKNVLSYNVSDGNLNSIRRKLKNGPGKESVIIAAEKLKIKQLVEKKATSKTTKRSTGKNVSGMTRGVNEPNRRRSNVLTTLAKLRNNKAPVNGRDRAAWQVLASVYRDHPSTQLQKYVNMNDEEREKFMTRQHEALTKSTALLESKSTVVDISMNTEKMHDLLLMLWLDMSHDGLFSGSFNKYLNSDIKKLFSSVKIKPTKTKLVDEFIKYGPIVKINKNGEIVKTSDIEKKLKTYMHDIWGDPSHPPKKIGKTRGIRDLIKNRNNPVYVSYDAENSDYVTTLLQSSFAPHKNGGTYFLKRLFTVANLMDPGRGAAANLGGFGKSGGSVDKLMNRLFTPRATNNGNFFIQTPFKFNYQMLTFNFGEYFKVELVQDGYKFNAKLNGKLLNMQVKASVARKGNTIDKISKTFGDFLQILTVSHLRRTTNKPVVSSSQDGGFVGMTGYVQSELFGIEPMLISDDTGLIGTGNSSTGIMFYGLHNYLKQNAMPTYSRPTTLQFNSEGSAASMNFRGNNNNNVNSGNTSSNKNANAKLAAMLMKQSTPPKPNNASKSNKNLAQALANSKRLTNKWQSLKKNVLARRNKIRNNFRAVVSAAVKQNKNKKEVEKKARENAENEMSRLRVELEEAKKAALSAQKEVENQRQKNIKRKREENRLNINTSRKTRSRP